MCFEGDPTFLNCCQTGFSLEVAKCVNVIMHFPSYFDFRNLSQIHWRNDQSLGPEYREHRNGDVGGALKLVKVAGDRPPSLHGVSRCRKAKNELLLPVNSRLCERQRKNITFSRPTNVDEGINDHANTVGAVLAFARRNVYNCGKVQVVVQGIEGIVDQHWQIYRANGKVAVSGVRGSRVE